MASFGIVSEGYTDQLLLEGILEGFFKGGEDAPEVKFLSPVFDETDAAQGQKAGWYQVFEYCKHQENFVRDLQFNDYLIIQIDTDVSEETHYDVKNTDTSGAVLSPHQLVADVIKKFQGLIGQPFLTQYGERLIFAISVHSIECWLLPIFGKTPSDKKKIVNCLGTLNTRISPVLNFTIDTNNKSHDDHYEVFAKCFAKNNRNNLIALGSKNLSFDIFLTQLCGRFPL